MEGWAEERLAKQRETGKKCLEIKYIQGKPYVYYSTSTYNRETKKTKKISEYIGRLTPDRGLLVKGSTRPSQEGTTTTTTTNTPIPRPRSAHDLTL
ncbi:hypothetical protein FTO68_11505 [Methanocalculus taiwanensis]|uniref:Transposase n=1 Tax=Methanocalculus taiwanensis TaxID=106207 RepID=A0ABD4TPA0_9EURY|nr:hypothetical protein [Methanocalculus taiwanensis]MCQ1539594.1 hypothetical protein [Methanocalculus taiwanensis]